MGFLRNICKISRSKPSSQFTQVVKITKRNFRSLPNWFCGDVIAVGVNGAGNRPERPFAYGSFSEGNFAT